MKLRCLPLVAAATLAACGSAPGDAAEPEASDLPAVVVDDLGRNVPVAPPATRVVSLLPSATDLVLALGAGDRLQARTRHDRDPRIDSLPSLGGGMTPNLEALVRLEPDLVVAWAEGDERGLTTRLEALGIRTYAAKSETIGDLERHLGHFGALLGLEDEADSVRAAIQEGLSRVSARVAGKAPVSVLYVVWHDPPVTTGADTFLDSVITVAGGRNAFGDLENGWPRVSLEEIVRRDPDVVVAAGAHDGTLPDPEWLREAPWRSLRAVQEERIIVVDADLFNRPGPRVVEAARTLARFLHPDLVFEETEP